MNMLTLPCNIDGQIISIPNEILITKRYFVITSNTHFVLSLHDNQHLRHHFKIINSTNKNLFKMNEFIDGFHFLPNKIQYIPCTLDNYNKMKAFM